MRKVLFSLASLTVIALLVVCFWPKKAPFKQLNEVSFTTLNDWKQTKLFTAFSAFQKSCQHFLKQPQSLEVGSDILSLKSGDWHPVCQRALALEKPTNRQLHQFYEDNFSLYQVFARSDEATGLFTGYYAPVLKGRLEKDARFKVPLYKRPKHMMVANLREFSKSLPNKYIVGHVADGRFKPYFTRAEIDKGAMKDDADVLAWIEDEVDRSFLQIQGSGIIELPDGRKLYAGYDGQNGKSYTAIAKVLIDKGVMTRDNASMQGIRAYLNAHPEEKEAVLASNEAFVFFKSQKEEGAIGSQGVVLTDEASLAVDRQYLPLGAPIWLETSAPVYGNMAKPEPFHHLMVAQDTGGAIKGAVRGDIYWGSGDKAFNVAGKMKNQGRYYLLLPKHVTV